MFPGRQDDMLEYNKLHQRFVDHTQGSSLGTNSNPSSLFDIVLSKIVEDDGFESRSPHADEGRIVGN